MRRPAAVAIVLVLLVALFSPAWVQAQTGTPVPSAQPVGTLVADGIANPRGFTWGADGTLYLAVSGTGGDTPGPEGSPFSGGDTASVAVVRDGTVTTLADGLPSSIWRDIDWVWGVMDVAILGDQLYALVGGGGAVHGNPDTPSGVYTVNADGTTSLLADLGTWVDENPVAHTPPEGAPNNGSFFAMVPVGEALWVVDAVNGQVLQTTPSGEITRIADLSDGHPVPSGITADPNGGAYVSYLTAAPFVAGSSRVSHVSMDGTVEDVWTGLTTVTAVTLSPDGTLYATEMSSEISAAEPFLTRNTGRVVRQTGPNSMEEVASGLDLPVAARFGPDGALYVALPAFGANDGTDSVVRLDEAATQGATGTAMATPLATPVASSTG
jgi:hypothetical protein